MSKDIQSYQNKRGFSQTPAPPPRKQLRKLTEPVFVVHRHEARRLHYDLRLQVAGVLKSFAVPKGFSFDPEVKHPAVRIEDQPLESEHFAGVIPQGQGDAALTTIWDRGPYELLNGPWEAAIVSGQIELRMRGSFLRGEWHLVKLKKEQDQWLVFKTRDIYAREKEGTPVSLALLNVPRRPMPQRLSRMEIGDRSSLFVHPDWLYEPLLPGLRLLAEKKGARVRFRGARRRLNSVAGRVIAALQGVRAENAIIDGILVCLDDDNRPCSLTLERTLLGEQSKPIFYYAFDLLYYDEWDLRDFSLAERKAALSSILPRHSAVVYVDHERNRAAELFETVSAVGLRGIVAKSSASPYRRGPSDDWMWIPAGRTPRRPRGPHQRKHRSTRTRSVVFTNRSKVLWPRAGYTKGDLIDYYEEMADWLLPYLRDRPLSLNRFPNGIAGDSFFQKDTPEHAPDWLQTILVESKQHDEVETRFLLCNDRSTLLYVANRAAIELHPWSSRRESLESPDWAVLVLDSTTDDFSVVVRVARAVEELLRELELRPYLKTSGAQELHIYIPLVAGYTYEQVRMFCEDVARAIAIREPALATIERSKPRRDGKVYIDFLQNRQGPTVVAPYVVRPVPAASVSAPLAWEELTDDLHPSNFTITNIAARAAQLGDLFASTLHDCQDLLPAIDSLQHLVNQTH